MSRKSIRITSSLNLRIPTRKRRAVIRRVGESSSGRSGGLAATVTCSVSKCIGFNRFPLLSMRSNAYALCQSRSPILEIHSRTCAEVKPLGTFQGLKNMCRAPSSRRFLTAPSLRYLAMTLFCSLAPKSWISFARRPRNLKRLRKNAGKNDRSRAIVCAFLCCCTVV